MKMHIFLLLIGLGVNCADYSDLTEEETRELDDEILIRGSQQDLVKILIALEMDKSPQANDIKSLLQDCVDIMEKGKENVNPEQLKSDLTVKSDQLQKICENIEQQKENKRRRLNDSNTLSNAALYTGIGVSGYASSQFAKYLLDSLKMDTRYPQFKYEFKGINADISANTIINFVVITGVIGFVSFLWKKIHNFFESKEDELVEKALEANRQTKAEIDKLKSQVLTLEGVTKDVANKLSEALHVLGGDILPVVHHLQEMELHKLHGARRNLETIEKHIQDAQISLEEHGDSELKIKQKKVFWLKRLFRKAFNQKSKVVPFDPELDHKYRDFPGSDESDGSEDSGRVAVFGAGVVPGPMDNDQLPSDDDDFLEIPGDSAMAQVD